MKYLSEEIQQVFKDAGLFLVKDNGFWVYDNDEIYITLYVSLNGLGKIGVFGSYSDKEGNEYSLASNMSDWLENFKEDIPFMREGKKLPW